MIVAADPPRSPAGRRQDDQWAAYVAGLTADAAPFAEQLHTFRRIYANRTRADGPPLAWWPGAAHRTGSNLAAAMADRGIGEYAAFHAWSHGDLDAFWRLVLERLAVPFTVPPEGMLDRSAGPTRATWLPGARFTCVDACLTAPADRPAIRFAREGDAAPSAWSYRELGTAVERVASGLHARGLAGRGVALYMPMTPECVAAYLGVIRAGGYVVSIADSFPAPELRARCGLADAAAVVTVDRYRRGGRWVDVYARVREAEAPRAIVIPPGDGESSALRAGDLWWDEFLGGAAAVGRAPDDPTRPINVLFSSGTTGTPKAIPWTHLTPLKCAMDGHFHQDIHATDTVAWPTNVGWMMGPWLIFATLVNRGTMALFEGNPASADFVRFVAHAGVSVLGVIPSLVKAWRRSDLVDAQSWRGIRLFSSTGEASSQEDYLWLMSRAGHRAPVIEYLGGTEIGGGHITGTVVQPASPATFTTPALGIDVALLDDRGQPCAPGDEGELFLVPPALGLSDRLLHHDHHAVYYEGCPAGPGGIPLRRHGDQMALLHQGFVKAQGRADDTMNLGGIKVSAREIERVVDMHDAVYESAAVAVQPEGEGADRLVLYVVPGHAADPAALRRDLGARIAAELNPLFKVHDLVVVDRLPRTASNKVMRRELRAQYRAPASPPRSPGNEREESA